MTNDFDSLRQRVKAILMDLNIGNFGMYAQYAEPKTDAIMEALANRGRELQVRCYQAIKRAAAMLPMLADDRDTKGRKTIDDFADELNELRIELDAVLGAEQSANRGREGQGGAGQDDLYAKVEADLLFLSEKLNGGEYKGVITHAIMPTVLRSIRDATLASRVPEADVRRLALERAACVGHQTAFEFLGMDKAQRMYSWHDVDDALTEATKAIRDLAAKPAPTEESEKKPTKETRT